MAAGQDDLDPASTLANFEDHSPNPLINSVRFAGNLLAARQKCLNLTYVDDSRATFKSNDRATDDCPFEVFKFVIKRVAFGFANLLDHDLFCRLRSNTAKNVADDFGIQLFAVAGNSRLATFSIHVDFELVILAKVLARGRQDRLFDPLEHDLFVNIFVAMNCVDDSQYFRTVHLFRFPVRRLSYPARLCSPIRSSRVGMRRAPFRSD